MMVLSKPILVLSKPILLVFLISTSLVVNLLDVVAAAGLTFMGSSHYSVALISLVVIACFVDLPASLLAIKKPRLAASLVLCGAC